MLNKHLSFRMSGIIAGFLTVLLLSAAWVPTMCGAETIAVKSGQKIAFLGDSITAMGWGEPGGFVHLVVAGLATQGIKVTPIPAGISGNTSKDMLARLQRDVLSKKPNWMMLSCGVNDVWHGPVYGVALSLYKQNITKIVDRAQAEGIKVVILTATLIGENPANFFNKKLEGYNAFLRKLAVKKHCRLVDVSADEIAKLKQGAHDPRLNGQLLTIDGVHPNAWGNMMFATAILKGLGFNQQQLLKAKKAWLNIPLGYPLDWRTSLTLREFNRLKALAAGEHCSMDQLLNREMTSTMHKLLGKSGSR